jgi:aspartate/methionine/tyrosine aminotransferase
VGRPNHRPAGTIFLMAGLPAWWRGTDVEFVERAMEEACVSVVPGAAFGLTGCVRFSYGGLTAAALSQLDQNLTRFRAKLAAEG